MAPQIIAFASQKGGVAKTTSAVSTAAALAESGASVCLVDADPQCNSTQAVIDPETLPETGTIADLIASQQPAENVAIDFEGRFPARFALIPGNKNLNGLDKVMGAEEERAKILRSGADPKAVAQSVRLDYHTRLKRSLKSYDVDYVLIDTPPSLGFPMVVALAAADYYVIPTGTSMYDLKGLQELLNTVNYVRQHFNPDLDLLGILLTKGQKRTNLFAEVKSILSDSFDEDVLFENSIRFLQIHEKGPYQHLTIVEYASSHDAAEEYRKFAKELVGRIRNKQQSSVGEGTAQGIAKEAGNA